MSEVSQKKAFDNLCYFLSNAVSKRDLYIELFLNEEAVSLMNGIARSAFRHLQVALANDLMMTVFRLLDPEKSCGDKNLSLGYLQKEFDDESLSLSETYQSLVDLKKEVNPYRHKVLAHNDFKRLIESDGEPIIFGWGKLNEVIDLFIVALGTISEKKYDTTFDFSPVTVGGGESLVAYFKNHSLDTRGKGRS